MTSELLRRVGQAAAAIVAGRAEMRRAGDVGALHDALLGQLEVVGALEPRTAAAFAVAVFDHLGRDDHDLAMEWAQYALLYHGGAVRRPFTPEEIAAAVEVDRRAVSKAATGTADELARQGMLTRCLRLERAPRGGRWYWAWTFDDLGSPNTARSLRRYRAKRLREERAAMLEWLAAEDRLYVITDLGRTALVAAAMAADRVALGTGPAEERV